jgi:hypothetical protein
MIVFHGVKIVLEGMTNEDCVFGNNCIQKGMKSLFYGIGDRVKDFLCDSAVLCIVVKYGVFGFEKIVEDDFFLII